jgi:hypothetical protein
LCLVSNMPYPHEPTFNEPDYTKSSYNEKKDEEFGGHLDNPISYGQGEGRRVSLTDGRRVSVVDDVFGEIVEGGPNYRSVSFFARYRLSSVTMLMLPRLAGKAHVC